VRIISSAAITSEKGASRVGSQSQGNACIRVAEEKREAKRKRSRGVGSRKGKAWGGGKNLHRTVHELFSARGRKPEQKGHRLMEEGEKPEGVPAKRELKRGRRLTGKKGVKDSQGSKKGNEKEEKRGETSARVVLVTGI